jgi:hypothetical protein
MCDDMFSVVQFASVGTVAAVESFERACGCFDESFALRAAAMIR